MNRLACTFIMCLAAAPAFACRPDLAARLFLNTNDQNRNGVLTASEWSHARSSADLALAFKLRDPGDFNRLDNNRNGKIERKELEAAVRFKNSPCEGWPWEKRQGRDD